ncbi:MAG: hypothetical protein ACRC3Z_09660 [Phocaeicola sp.]
MKTQNLVLQATPASARKFTNLVATIKTWFNRENRLFSSIWEERVTNKEVLITCNAALSFVPLLALSFERVLPALVAVSYFAFSAYLCKASVSKSD